MKKTSTGILIFSLVLIGLRLLSPERSLFTTGPRALFDALFALGLLLLVLLLAAGLGSKILGWLRLEEMDGLERMLFSLTLGLGVLAYGILLLGLLGLLHPWAVAAWLAVVAIFAGREILSLVQSIGLGRSAWPRLDIDEKLVAAVLGLILLFSFLQALTPAWDYDGLIYHLQGPRLFLQAGRIYPENDNLWIFYPFTVEMLYTLGMAFGSDTFAKLLHLSLAVALVLATLAFTYRHLGRRPGALAIAILVGIPIFPIWASLAYNDVPWALFEFLALCAAFRWKDDRRPAWLLLSGLLMGLALGTKYMALAGAGALAAWLFWHSLRSPINSQSTIANLKSTIYNTSLFLVTALLTGSPWYIKNAVLAGNPVYPFYFTTQQPVAGQVALWMAYMDGFGVGRRLVDYLLLPINLYRSYDQFGTFLGSIEIPSFLFPLLLLYPWVRKTPFTNSLFAWVGLRFAVWAVGTQQIRYLLPLYPALSLLTAHILIELAGRLRRASVGRVLVRSLALGMLAAALIYSLLFLSLTKPLAVIVGTESKDTFLARMLALYPFTRTIQQSLPPEARVLFLWDGRGYYCDARCLPDVEQSQWTYLSAQNDWDVQRVAVQLNEAGVTHLLLSYQDMNFIIQYDVSGKHLRAARFAVQDFLPACTKVVEEDQYYALLELVCP